MWKIDDFNSRRCLGQHSQKILNIKLFCAQKLGEQKSVCEPGKFLQYEDEIFKGMGMLPDTPRNSQTSLKAFQSVLKL